MIVSFNPGISNNRFKSSPKQNLSKNPQQNPSFGITFYNKVIGIKNIGDLENLSYSIRFKKLNIKDPQIKKSLDDVYLSMPYETKKDKQLKDEVVKVIYNRHDLAIPKLAS